jgi:hypothetical protein
MVSICGRKEELNTKDLSLLCASCLCRAFARTEFPLTAGFSFIGRVAGDQGALQQIIYKTVTIRNIPVSFFLNAFVL